MNLAECTFLFRRSIDKLLERLPFTRSGHSKRLCQQLAIFAPNSLSWIAGIQGRAAVALQGANDTILALESIGTLLFGLQKMHATPIEDIPLDQDAEDLARALAVRLTVHGSDKAAVHGYERLYATILAPWIGERRALLEIGLGSNRLHVPSNMGINGKPGASVRAFRDVLDTFAIYGADVDRTILFEEERIETFYVDQTRRETFQDLASRLPALDIIIDDGLHAPHSNLNTLVFAMEKLNPKGYLVVEDVTKEALPVWEIVSLLLRTKGWAVAWYQGRCAFVVVVQKP